MKKSIINIITNYNYKQNKQLLKIIFYIFIIIIFYGIKSSYFTLGIFLKIFVVKIKKILYKFIELILIVLETIKLLFYIFIF